MEAFKKLQYMTKLTPKKRDQKKEIKKLAAKIKELKKENAELRYKNYLLRNKNNDQTR